MGLGDKRSLSHAPSFHERQCWGNDIGERWHYGHNCVIISLVEPFAHPLGEYLSGECTAMCFIHRRLPEVCIKEPSTCSHRLNDNDKSFVSPIGVCPTLEQPFALVFKFMGRLDLVASVERLAPDIGMLELVHSHRNIRRFIASTPVAGNGPRSEEYAPPLYRP